MSVEHHKAAVTRLEDDEPNQGIRITVRIHALDTTPTNDLKLGDVVHRVIDGNEASPPVDLTVPTRRGGGRLNNQSSLLVNRGSSAAEHTDRLDSRHGCRGRPRHPRTSPTTPMCDSATRPSPRSATRRPSSCPGRRPRRGLLTSTPASSGRRSTRRPKWVGASTRTLCTPRRTRAPRSAARGPTRPTSACRRLGRSRAPTRCAARRW